MKLMINIDVFRKYYHEAIGCKTVLNSNADSLSLDDERRVEALLPIVDEYGLEMEKN